jgi:hypothetical protein
MVEDGAQGHGPLISTGEAVTDTLLAPFRMLGLFGEDDERPPAPRRVADPTEGGTLFYGSDLVGDGLDGLLMGGQAAFYGPNPDAAVIPDPQTAESLYGDVGLAHDLNPTLSHEETLDAFLDGDAYLVELADVDGQRWAARQDPWDGP